MSAGVPWAAKPAIAFEIQQQLSISLDLLNLTNNK
jgi:hypothetical protein